MSSGVCVWKESGSGFRAAESIGSRPGISGRPRPRFLTADGPWAHPVASSTFSLPRVRTTEGNRLGKAVGGDKTPHLARSGLSHVLEMTRPEIPEWGESRRTLNVVPHATWRRPGLPPACRPGRLGERPGCSEDRPPTPRE